MFLADITDNEVFDIINNAPNRYSYDLNYYCIKKFSNVLVLSSQNGSMNVSMACLKIASFPISQIWRKEYTINY